MLALLGAVLLTAAGCGGGGLYGPAYVDPYIGAAELDNLSVEYVEGFYMAPAATTLFTGELLGAPLPPGFVQYVGEFEEDYYDAEADMEFGDLVQWFDVFVFGDDVTTFEVY
jgi:hypothetical protein